MRIKQLTSVLILTILFTSSVFPISSSATSWAYSFVVWDGYIYVVSDEYVTEVGSEIGHVTKYSDMEQHSGNFSNVYKKGTKYFSIEGISTDVAIAIKEEDDKYRKALREGEYTYKGEFSFGVVGVLILFITLMISIYFIRQRKVK